MDLRSANAKTSAQLNLTKPEAERAGKVAGELYSKNLGGSMSEVSDGLGAVMGSFRDLRGASEAELVAAGEAALTFAKVMEVDVGAAATTAGTLVENGLAKDATSAFDLLSAAAQEVGPQMVEPLMDAVDEYGKHFSMLGFTGEQTMSTLAAAAEGGEISIDKAGDAIKEFGIRATDLNDTGAQEALEALGLSGTDMANDLLAGGERAQDATKTITDALLGVEDPAERAALAGGLFGTQIEDMGKDQLPGFLEALSGAGEGLGDVEGRTADMGKTLDEGGGSLARFGRGVQSELIDMMSGAVDWLSKGEAGMEGLTKYTQPAVIALGAFAGAVGLASLAMKIYNSWALITKVATGIATAAQWAWNAALTANPIGLVIAAIAALVGGLYLFFTRTEKGKEIWAKVWGFIKSSAKAVADWFTGTLVPVLQSVWAKVSDGALWMYNNGIKPAWEGIRSAVGAVASWVTGTLVPALQSAWSGIAAAAMWLWQKVLQPAWVGIKTAVAIAVTAVLVYIDLLKWYFSNVIAPVAMWLWQKVLAPAWSGIRSAIGAVVDWFQNTAWPALKAAWDAVAAAAQFLWRQVLVPVWAGIRAAIDAVVDWFKGTAWPLIQTVIGWLKLSFEGWKMIAQAVWAAVRSAVSAVVTWLRDTAWPVVQRVLDRLKAGFNVLRDVLGAAWSFIRHQVIAPVVTWFRDTVWGRILSPTLDRLKRGFNVMRDALGAAWDYVRNKVINPVATWFRDTIQPLFDRSTTGVSDAFGTMKDAIRKAWEAIRDTAKTPVKFVVNKIINDAIIGNYNDVAKTFGLDPIKEVSLPSGWARGGILPGYTPMGAGDDRLTPMRSGEGVLVSEGLRDRASRSAFLAANKAAKMGRSFADFVQGYAGGGIVKLGMPFSGSAPRGDGFGARGGAHKGIDWPLAHGTALRAVAAGTASRASNAAAGNKLNLAIGNGLVAGYHHLSRYGVGNGARVGAGATVGYVGNTGRSSGPHLHFSLKRNGSYVDPAPYLGAGGAGGSGGGWNPFAGLWDSLKAQVRDGVGSSPFGDLLYKLPQKVIGGALDWVGNKITALGDWGSEAMEGVAGRTRWSGVMTQALGMKNQFGPMRLKWGLDRLMQESSGDPNAVNNWDSNAAAGQASRGLMQVIPSTFRAYAEPGYGSNIFDPLSNILASINYTLARYGSLEKGWTRAGGYATGTVNASPGWHMVGEEGPEMIRFRGGERVLTAEETRRQMAGGNPGGLSDDDIDRLATRIGEEVRGGSREGVAAGLSGSAARARSTARMGVL